MNIQKSKISVRRQLITKIVFCVLIFFFALQSNAYAKDMGSVKNFLIDSAYDLSGRDSVNVTLVYTSEDAYIYVENQYYNALTSEQKADFVSQIQTLGKEFDETIYPTTKKYFGEEWNPGIDGDSKMVILFDRLQYNVGGYFNPNDEYTKDEVLNGRSNEAEMIYLNPDFLKTGKVEGFLSHEFQHMIYWNEKTRIKGVVDDTWINEGRAELACSIIEDALGRNFNDQTLAVRKKDFLINYADSLMDWSNANYDYSSVNIFMEYLKDHFGTAIFKDMNNNSKIGADDLDSVLKTDDGIGLNTVFTNWTIANYINDVNFDVRDGYENVNLKTGFNITPNIIYDKNNDNKINLTSELKNWSGDYYQVDLKDKNTDNLYLGISFSGNDAGNFAVPYVINYKNGTKEVGYLNMDSKQDGSKNLSFRSGTVDSIVFIPSSQKMEPLDSDGQVKNYNFSLNVEFVTSKDITHPDGTLVKLSNDNRIYLVQGGQKKWIPDIATFVSNGFNWDNVVVIGDLEMNLYVSGDDVKSKVTAVAADGTLIKGDGPEIYLVDGGKKRWITDAQTFISYGFSWKNVIKVSEQSLAYYPDGSALTKSVFVNGNLIKGPGPNIYIIENGKKRWITNPAAFVRNKFSWSSVKEASAEIIASYPDGANIDK